MADLVQLWFEKEAVDGFIIIANLPSQLEAFVKKVVPILQEKGIFRTDYIKDTLRGNLGLHI